MAMKLYTIKDEKAGIFFRPNVYKTTMDAIRQVAMEANDPKSILHNYPDDFGLYELGSMDEETGIISSTPPHKISDIQSLIKKESNNG